MFPMMKKKPLIKTCATHLGEIVWQKMKIRR